MELVQLYSTREAADYLGITVTSLRRQIGRGEIEPIALGERKTANGSTYPHGFVFTERMLDETAGDRLCVEPTEEERACIYNTARAASYLGVSSEAVKQAYHVRKILTGKKVGNDVVFLLKDIQAYADRQRPSGTKHPRALFDIQQIRNIRTWSNLGKTVPQIMEIMSLDCDETAVYGVLSGRTYRFD